MALDPIPARFTLPWSAYVRLLAVKKKQAREFYVSEALSHNKAAMLEKGERPASADVASPEEVLAAEYRTALPDEKLTAALRLSQLCAGFARLPRWEMRPSPKPHPAVDSSSRFSLNRPVTRIRVHCLEALQALNLVSTKVGQDQLVAAAEDELTRLDAAAPLFWDSLSPRACPR